MLQVMASFGPSEFLSLTGLSAKAVRLYEERGILRPSVVDAATGYRSYSEEDVSGATRIALLRRAGIGLGDIARFLDAPDRAAIDRWLSELEAERSRRRSALEALGESFGLGPTPREEPAVAVVVRSVESLGELEAAFDTAGAQFEPVIDHDDERRFTDLRTAFDGQRELLLVAEADRTLVGAALGFLSSGGRATLRIIGVAPRHRRQGIGSGLLRAFEQAVVRLGGESVWLGADEAVGFYVRHGYRTLLLLQWVYDPSLFEPEMSLLLSGPLAGMESWPSSFNDVPQLFVVLDEPTPAIRSSVEDLVTGAHVGYCMTRRLGQDNGVESSPSHAG
jgi:DNA-binding transcriptional MerR regulator